MRGKNNNNQKAFQGNAEEPDIARWPQGHVYKRKEML